MRGVRNIANGLKDQREFTVVTGHVLGRAGEQGNNVALHGMIIC